MGTHHHLRDLQRSTMRYVRRLRVNCGTLFAWMLPRYSQGKEYSPNHIFPLSAMILRPTTRKQGSGTDTDRTMQVELITKIHLNTQVEILSNNQHDRIPPTETERTISTASTG